jgi:hypothetical protein
MRSCGCERSIFKQLFQLLWFPATCQLFLQLRGGGGAWWWVSMQPHHILLFLAAMNQKMTQLFFFKVGVIRGHA